MLEIEKFEEKYVSRNKVNDQMSLDLNSTYSLGSINIKARNIITFYFPSVFL